MKKQILISLISINSLLTMNAQWLPSGNDALYSNGGKVLIQSNANNYGQFQILNPRSDEASMCFIGLGTSFGGPPQSSGGNSHIWSLGSNIWGNGGNVFGIGNNDYFMQSGNGQIFFVKSNGTVGIGASPLGKLYVDAGTSTGIEGKVLIKSGSDGHGQLQIMNPTGAESSIGFIGSGTTFGTSPQSSAGNSNIWVIGNNVWGNGGNVFGIGNDDYANTHNNNGQIIGINSNGNVGIGTSSPYYKLDVIGTIRAREIKVDLNGADFVFEKNFKLMPLNELEKFVKEQKHLPEIASAKEMEQDGTNLGNLNSKLLQKIEELTLYTIDQQKQIDELKKQNQELQILKEKIARLEAASK